MSKEFSLQTKIALPILTITFLALGLLTYFSASTSFQTAKADAEFKVSKSAEAFANAFKAELDASLMVAQQIEAYLGTLRHQSHKPRADVNAVLKSMLIQAPSVFGVWATFEPDAFDGKDAQYLGQPGYEKIGGFGPYWNRSGENGALTWENDINYDGEFYVAPKKAGRRILTEPYYDEVNGKNLLMTSAAAPLFENNLMKGVVGVDLLLAQLEKQIAAVKPYDTSVGYLISDHFNYVTNPVPDLVGKPVNLPFANEEFKKALQAGSLLLKFGTDPQTQQEILNILVPVSIPYSNTHWGVLISTPVKTVLASAYSLLWNQLIVFAICLLVMGAAVYIISRRISRRFTGLTQSLEQSENVLTSAIDQLSRAGQNLAQSATESAASIEETVASLEEMTSMVQMNAGNAKEAARLSSDSNQSAERGNTEMGSLVGAMTEISDSSRKIAEINSVIDDLAFQTNLLALNASVEAARAGEHGKGFAVVAEAVRTLAQKSASAAKDINVLINDSIEKVQRGSQKAESSNSNLKEIVESVRKVSHLNGEISSASNEQSTGIQQISKAMNSLDQSIQTNAASAEEISATVQEILNQALVMKKVVTEMNSVVHGN
ncbi:methyl-accepting chemotaxis protein [Bdellovibrio bacteriovorus]|uniref:MCP methyl chemotaxis protein n=1 Tax=Bdellovibrio bacteriovorus str. Tiberius TaxID=1069642 RepID=K7YZH6_BDEBC|nr:methyl-accepting chemotaxis protein [Bdellovibrio bacteriovorus]AFY02125.1 MCP methyl chemotaxis protein [Bdellovibrio bacteriovorus str. Tiberius]